MKPDFLPPIGNAGDNPITSPAGYDNWRQTIKGFWDISYYENSSNCVRIEKFLDGSETDHTNVFKEAIAYCKTNDKDLLLERGKTYTITDTIDITNIRLYGNFSKIDGHMPATPFFGVGGMQAIYITATENLPGAFYPVDEDVKINDRWVKITNSTFLSSVKQGDTVIINSSKIFGDGLIGGEMHKVYSVNEWGIYLDDFLFSSYFTSDNAKISRVANKRCEIYDLEIVHNTTYEDFENENAIGIIISNCIHPITKNVIVKNTGHKAIAFNNCYNPVADDCYTSGTAKDVYGYGISIAGVSTNAIIENCNMYGGRHPFHSGGSTFGVPWNIVVKNCRASNGYVLGGTCYDAHRSVGSVLFENCHAFGGRITKVDYNLYDIGTQYDSGNVVRSLTGIVYSSLENNNTGNDLNDLNWWTPSNGSNAYGWNLRCLGTITIKNCYAYGLSRVIVGKDQTVGNIIIDGIQSYDCNETVNIQNQEFNSLSIQNVKHYRNAPSSPSVFAIYISSSTKTIKNAVIRNVEVIGQRGLYYAAQGSVLIENISCDLGTNFSGSIGLRFSCNNVIVNNAKLKGYDYPIWTDTVGDIDASVDVDDFLDRVIYAYNNINNITLSGSVKNPRNLTSCHAVYCRRNVNHVFIPHIYYDGDVDFYLTGGVPGYAWTSLNYGNVVTDGPGSMIREFSHASPPAVIILAGSNSNIKDCIVTATPEGGITANIGAIARDSVNGKVYFKATGAGNTGWREIQFV